MNYYVFFTLTSIISTFLAIFLLVKLTSSYTTKARLALFVSVVLSFSLMISSITFLIMGPNIRYEITESPICLEESGKAQIKYVWHQNDNYVIHNNNAYAMNSTYIRNSDNVIALFDKGKINQLKAYKYIYPKYMGFLKFDIEKYTFALQEDYYIKQGLCKDYVEINVED